MFFIRTIERFCSIRKIHSISTTETNGCTTNIKIIKSIPNDKHTCLVYPPSNMEYKGIIQFVGGFISGSFPFTFCGYFLSLLAKSGYVVVVYKISLFNLNHFELAFNLLKRQKNVRQYIENVNTQENLNIRENIDYFWVAYSIGCKLVTLLEVMSSCPLNRKKLFEKYFPKFSTPKDRQLLESVLFRDYFSENGFNYIRDQASIFIAPEIRSTYSNSNNNKKGLKQVQDKLNTLELGIKLASLVAIFLGSLVPNTISIIISPVFHTISLIELDLFPNTQRIELLAKEAFNSLFGILGIIGLKGDTISSDDVEFFKNLYLKDQKNTPCRLSYSFVKDLANKNVVLQRGVKKITELENCNKYTNDSPIDHNMPCCAIGHGNLLKSNNLFEVSHEEIEYRPEEKNLRALIIDIKSFFEGIQQGI